MKSLFDTSAILNLAGSDKNARLFEGSTLSLARYEAGNAIWNKVSDLKTISSSEGRRILEAVDGILSSMGTVDDPSPVETLKVAVGMKITYYDAAFIVAAVENSMQLVTDDRVLRGAGAKYVVTKSSEDA